MKLKWKPVIMKWIRSDQDVDGFHTCKTKDVDLLLQLRPEKIHHLIYFVVVVFIWQYVTFAAVLTQFKPKKKKKKGEVYACTS